MRVAICMIMFLAVVGVYLHVAIGHWVDQEQNNRVNEYIQQHDCVLDSIDHNGYETYHCNNEVTLRYKWRM